MLAIIKIVNGVKKIIPLTADIGAGAPVGTIIVVCSNQIPSNYLPLGTQFDTSLYPVLYALLGTDTTPTASALGLPTLTSGQYAIKATSGLPENQQDNVLATINANNSYSTTEHATGKKWIDGKPIYRKVIAFGALPNSTAKSINHNISNIDFIVKVVGVTTNGSYYFEIPRAGIPNTNSVDLYTTKTKITIETSIDYSAYTATYIILEYTKTTD
jgi:hypothetical protein